MRHWIGSHLTFANVVSLAALFVALGGTATAVTYVVSSNSQIGPNTVAGHNPPSGKHSNLIAGSVDGKDVAVNSLTGADVNESSLTGGAKKLIYDSAANNLKKKFATVGPYRLKGECDKSIAGVVEVELDVNGPAGALNVMASVTNDDNQVDLDPATEGTGISAGTDTFVAGGGANPGHFQRVAGTAFIQRGSTLIQVDFDAVADARGSGDCFLRGTGTVAT